ncbi:MAG: bifunctional glutamate N-acetyltransferase/amino-acid acetyltransferase ArgJ [Pseudomonadota bacterium]|nr:bifunctional glutamate N-acetyltransferase/amino-acid acetyltransferase ArgJ [Pseudomonadota bacterium]
MLRKARGVMQEEESLSFNEIRGVRLAAIASGLKKNLLDLALIELNERAVCSAVFTQNNFAAAPVLVSREHLKSKSCRYLLINSGNANAATGDEGIRTATRCCQSVAEIAGLMKEEVLPFSTGVIGEPLDYQKIQDAIPSLFKKLAGDGWTDVARAIITTDTATKISAREVEIDSKKVKIIGIAKGSGMIQPNMATMLSFLATDASLERDLSDQILFETCEKTFNRITVDGDTSTNDACVLVSTGLSGVDCNKSPQLELMKQGIFQVMRDLAMAIVKDGEGATKFVEVRVKGGKTKEDSRNIAYSIANSPLVKTALFASDPNWGRLVMAVGKANAAINTSKIDIQINDLLLMKMGQIEKNYTEEKGSVEMKKPSILITVDLNLGQYEDVVWTTDLSHDYVKINSEYRT